MLSIYFASPCTLRRLRSGPSGPYLDGFADNLHAAGYSQGAAQKCLRVAAHLGVWGPASGHPIECLNAKALACFQQHLRSCRCPQSNGGQGADVLVRARLFLAYLREVGVGASARDEYTESAQPWLATSFLDWLRQHRGASEATCSLYGRVVVDLLRTLGDDPRRFTAATLRAFVFDRAGRHGRSAANNLGKALRMFLRYLIATGACPSGLLAAIPTFAHWRLASLPRYLPASLSTSSSVTTV